MKQENIGKIIKDIRIKNNLSQKEFADIFGVTYQAVSKWENNKNIPDLTILNAICNKFDISIDELLNNKKRKPNKLIYLVIPIILILIISTIIIILNKDNFEFKKITTSCNEFKVTGSIAYNKDKSSIYISDINYCGEENIEEYQEIKCTLFENNDKINKEIDSCIKKENTTLETFLKDVTFNVDNYEASCKQYRENSLYLEIEAINKENKIITYRIPLSLQENCSVME